MYAHHTLKYLTTRRMYLLKYKTLKINAILERVCYFFQKIKFSNNIYKEAKNATLVIFKIFL